MQGGGLEPKTLIQNKIRRLTPLECWRLQGFRDEDFFSVKDISDTQLYKQAGNSITVNVLMELFKKIYAHNNK
jgi:DNA (cytosine-5)-methyltransferase 1